MTSLRWRLLGWLLPLYAIAAAVAMLAGYRQYQASVNAFMDGQIHALARSETLRVSTSHGPFVARPVDQEAAQHHGTLIIQYWSRDGRLLSSSLPLATAALQGHAGFRDITDDGRHWRAYTVLSSPVRVQILQSADFRDRVILHSAVKSALPVLYLMPFTLAILWIAVHLSLRPLDRLVHRLADMDERNLPALPLATVPREILPLVASMDRLLQRLREAFTSQRRFVQDAAHELRTPLAAFVLQAENLRAELGDDAPEQLDRLDAGIRRQQRLVEQLLDLARREGAPANSERDAVEVDRILRESVAAVLPVADSRHIDVGSGAFEQSIARTDPDDLRLVFDNLLDNALRYTPEGGSVDVTLRQRDERIVVEIIDTGPGIPSDSLERVFDRFYRLPDTTATGGSGLGLAIVRAASLRGGFSVDLKNRSDGRGLVACVLLPTPG